MSDIDYSDIDYSDLGFPVPEDGLANPYDEDGYCEFCGNGSWKHHAPWCRWADVVELILSLRFWP